MRSDASREAMPGGTPGPASGCAQADVTTGSTANKASNVNNGFKTRLTAVFRPFAGAVTNPLIGKENAFPMGQI